MSAEAQGEVVEISASLVKELRDITGAGMMDCKKALEGAKGDIVEATEILRRKGLAELRKKAGRVAKEGIIDAYVHAGGRIAVLVEVNCETDFVARNETFREFAHDMAMQVAAADPTYVARENVPDGVAQKELEIYRAQALDEGKPQNVVERIAEGRLEKFFKSNCLLEQAFIKDPDKTIEEYLGEVAGKIGEHIAIRRFVRMEVGEEG